MHAKVHGAALDLPELSHCADDPEATDAAAAGIGLHAQKSAGSA